MIATYVRTGPREPKHEGISLLLIDPQADGVEVRRTPTLARHILGTNEVYLSDVVVPRANLVGPQDKGWSVMLSNIRRHQPDPAQRHRPQHGPADLLREPLAVAGFAAAS